jgi:phosphoribosylanthranilate isomerase
MKINRVTITGADDKVEISELKRLSKKFPFVEWGILFSKNKLGTHRYPSQEWIKELIKNDELSLSAHYCGWWSKEVIEKQNTSIILTAINFKRIQINYTFRNKNVHDFFDSCKDFQKFLTNYKNSNYDKQIIIQQNHNNSKIIENSIITNKDFLEIYEKINFLYDNSGGNGKEIETIEETIGSSYTGYAGGIGEENIERICKSITENDDKSIVWIDLESGARDENNNFDLEKVERILQIASKYITVI